MLVEIGSMTSLEVGQKIYDALIDDDKIQLMFLETGRSHDLFEEKQFGEFGEASILSIIVNEEDQQNIFIKVYEHAGLNQRDQGIIVVNKKIDERLGK